MKFHKAFNLPVLDYPAVPSHERTQLRAALIREEYLEVMEALDIIKCAHTSSERLGMLTHLAKELADLRIVVEGAAAEFGIPLNDVYKIVCASNMSKLGDNGKPAIRADGKVLKGPNYRPAEPAIRALLEKLTA